MAEAKPGLPLVAGLLVGAVLVAFVVVRVLPAWEHAQDPARTTPGPITLVGTGIALSLLTAFALYVVLALRMRLPRAVVLLAIAYNVIVVGVKFGLGPQGLYETNRSRAFDDLGFSWQGAAALVFFLYAAVFLGLYAYARGRLRRQIATDAAPRSRTKLVALAFLLLVVGIFVAVPTYVFISLQTEYMSFALSGVTGVAIAVALVAAALLAGVAFESLSAQAAALRSAALLTTFLFVGLAFLAAYHVLWAVYIMLVVSLWPLRTVTGK